jgi:heavy metal translocating P-type ATPase
MLGMSRFRVYLAGVPLIGLAVGLAATRLGHSDWAALIWAASTIPVLIVLLIEIATSLRAGEFGLDIVAALSMTASIMFKQELAAVIVALMYSGGKRLEEFAERRARREMTALLERAPRTAIRYSNDRLEEVPTASIEVGDKLLIRQGDIVPVDGTVASGLAILNQSALTGESLPLQRRIGQPTLSGSTNVGDAFDLIASRRASESAYAGILRLVEAAQRSKAPMARLADRYALGFLAATVGLAAGAWILTGDPIRSVAVLVVATPCPLILAVPVAIVAGVSRAAARGILVKGGKALEGLARVRSIVIDKTGTLTDGRAHIVSTHSSGDIPGDEALRVAASLDQGSKHALAQAIVSEARERGLRLETPTEIAETPGEGIEGFVGGRRVVIGGMQFVLSRTRVKTGEDFQVPETVGSATVGLAIDGRLAAVLVLADPVRPKVASLLNELRSTGVERIVLATGDRRDVAEAIAEGLEIDSIRAELTPEQKVIVVISERKNGVVMMVGDGVNDAPALAAADVGVAMGARGAAAAAEVADVVLLVDSIDRVARAIEIAQRSRFIALESVYVGIGLSIIGMTAAALGLLAPVAGALAQEAIDVAVVLNALRALGGGVHFDLRPKARDAPRRDRASRAANGLGPSTMSPTASKR